MQMYVTLHDPIRKLYLFNAVRVLCGRAAYVNTNIDIHN